ncbi:MAG TPA: c-type cytochrome [Vicinamibacteria bacterium]|nr:c-type cytochrome [Vicinamibacteria bacterium]
MTRRLPITAGVLALLVFGAWLGVRHWRGRNVGPVERGFRTAQSHGCFTCHGPGGLRGYENEDGRIGSVPPFTPDEVTAHAKTVEEIREWILDGMPRRLRDEPPEPGEPPVITMPAWREVLSAREVDDIVAYVVAVSNFGSAPEGQALAGRDAAAALGCFQCHGPQGRGNAPNPGSLKGYIPSWDGADYPELVRDDAELREWIHDGSPRRLREHRVASHFLEKQAVKMPAYKDRVKEEELAAIAAYIKWVRKGS